LGLLPAACCGCEPAACALLALSFSSARAALASASLVRSVLVQILRAGLFLRAPAVQAVLAPGPQRRALLSTVLGRVLQFTGPRFGCFLSHLPQPRVRGLFGLLRLGLGADLGQHAFTRSRGDGFVGNRFLEHLPFGGLLLIGLRGLVLMLGGLLGLRLLVPLGPRLLGGGLVPRLVLHLAGGGLTRAPVMLKAFFKRLVGLALLGVALFQLALLFGLLQSGICPTHVTHVGDCPPPVGRCPPAQVARRVSGTPGATDNRPIVAVPGRHVPTRT
jgi:hypothetical protein